MTFHSKCVACKTHIREPLIIGGMEIDLCERCQPRPTSTKKVEGPRDEYDYHQD